MGVEGDLGKKNFSTYVIDGDLGKYGLHGYGNTANEAIEDTYVALEEIREIAQSDGVTLPDVEFRFSFDVGSLFSYFPYLNISAVAKRMGINESLMRKYASGLCTPSKKRREQIASCIHDISADLSRVNLV